MALRHADPLLNLPSNVAINFGSITWMLYGYSRIQKQRESQKQQLDPNSTNVPDYSRTTKSDPHHNRPKSTERNENPR
ncbi:hypothetical protein CABS01_17031 [Colletotrichum abscissum]|uniref:uncharacterized protein n=1 Tax=Colletotrichum abscissum TaxID=1671311 RepID=UPI0027D5E52A|nr:uncharacterized protein CABS01_17031 [Colletotrichum abscissum]KAK1498338.1 hypothetical protein CABS01_17031 [Colletotrichum abscissum]